MHRTSTAHIRGNEISGLKVSAWEFQAALTRRRRCYCSSGRTAERNLSFPSGNKPLAVISTLYDSPQYRELQRKLLAHGDHQRARDRRSSDTADCYGGEKLRKVEVNP